MARTFSVTTMTGWYCLLVVPLSSAFGATTRSSHFRVETRVSTTMQSRGYSAKYRPELAIIGGGKDYFESQKPPKITDDFTVSFSSSVKLRSVSVLTGNREGTEQLVQGVLELSADGVNFQKIGTFAEGKCEVHLDRTNAVAIRVRPTEDGDQRLVIRGIDLKSDMRFGKVLRVPRVLVDTSRTPDLGDWGLEAQKVAEDTYDLISNELSEKGYIGPNCIHLVLNPEYKGIAETSNDLIQISPTYIRGHQGDYGLIVHELTHTIQHYPRKTSFNWLTEGIADYVRLYLYEPYAPRPKISESKSRYTDGYRTTAAFLAYAKERFGRNFVNSLNQLVRDGKYDNSSFRNIAGKEPTELWITFLADLRQGRTKVAHL